jgi:hypothetical protein
MTNQTRNPRPPLDIKVTNATTTQLAKLRVLERYDLSFVADRIARENGSRPNSLSDAVLEFKRYMGLVALGYRGLPVPNQEVDDIWHAFLLFTREYAIFCRKTVGFFVHHIPTISSKKTKTPKSVRLSRAYRKIFGLDMLTTGHCNHCSSCRTGSSARAHF